MYSLQIICDQLMLQQKMMDKQKGIHTKLKYFILCPSLYKSDIKQSFIMNSDK